MYCNVTTQSVAIMIKTFSENLPKDSHHKILERHKFELLEDFRPSNDIGDRIEMREFTSDGHGRIGDWMQRKYSTETHPVNLMV